MQNVKNQAAIREFQAEDTAAFQALRLCALETNPEAFASSAEDWKALSFAEVEQRVRNQCTSDDHYVVGAFVPEAVGMMGLIRPDKKKMRHKCHIWGVFVMPEHRKRGFAAAMLDALIQKARGMPGVEQVQLTVIKDNVPAVRLYESRGFVAFGLEKNAMIVNGRYYDEIYMALALE